MALDLRSEAFGPQERIPRKYTDDGEDISPPLAWEGTPEDAVQLALICDDPDAPRPDPWVHWVLYGLSAASRHLDEGIAPKEEVAGVRQGKNSWDRIGYGGPAPPRGHGTHHYHFKLYALSDALDLEPGATKGQVERAMKGKILDQTELVGTYER